MKIIIIGGSMAGLSAGIALNCKGFETHIYEKSSPDMKTRGAGLVIQPDMIDYLIAHGITSKELFGVPATKTQILDRFGRAGLKYANKITSFTSWDHTWQQLKNHYPRENYHFSHTVEKIEQREDKVYVTFTDGTMTDADLLIGADGYHSVVREHLFPGLLPKYAGYIAYRGLVSETLLTAEEITFFENKMTLYEYHNSRIMAFLIPGTDGELTKGKRILNWVWSCNKSDASLHNLMLDKNGKQRDFSLPQKFMTEDNITEVYNSASLELPERFSTIVRRTEFPFAQAIVDLSVPKMFDGRIVLIGDAAFVVRPHTAAGTAKASRDAIALADSLQYHKEIQTALELWEVIRKREIQQLAQHGKELALKNGFGSAGI
jgi:2-polyprenyl-6-methoxyphenol hydroxylase-like FAD-dependent oxidoreductase